MNFAWLEDFLALAESGNFSRAAEERHVTQPAFSRRIRALEAWLGAELLDRSGQPAQLTEAGKWFSSVAQELLARVARLPGEARVVSEASAATLRFASTHALSFTFMPGWLRTLESRLAVGPIRLVSDVLPRCEALLRAHQVQFVLSHAHPAVPDAMKGFASIQVGSDWLVPVAAADAKGEPLFRFADPLSADPLSADRGPRLPVLSYSAESGLGRILETVHATALERLPMEVVFTAHLASVLRTMAVDGRGIAWLPRSLIDNDLATGRLAEAGPAWHIALEVRLYRDDLPLGPAAQAFWAAAGAVIRP